MEAWQDAAAIRVARLVSLVEIPLPGGTGMLLAHEYAPGDRTTPWRRLQVGVTHSLRR